eukprot:15461416-Alexandrium_andersonii.AAC.1
MALGFSRAPGQAYRLMTYTGKPAEVSMSCMSIRPCWRSWLRRGVLKATRCSLCCANAMMPTPADGFLDIGSHGVKSQPHVCARTMARTAFCAASANECSCTAIKVVVVPSDVTCSSTCFKCGRIEVTFTDASPTTLLIESSPSCTLRELSSASSGIMAIG